MRIDSNIGSQALSDTQNALFQEDKINHADDQVNVVEMMRKLDDKINNFEAHFKSIVDARF